MNELDEVADLAQRLAVTFGTSMEETSKAIQGMAMALGGLNTSVDRTEWRALQRVAHMAAQLVPAMREAGIDDSHYAEFTALLDALLTVQAFTKTQINPLPEEELARDLVELARDLEQPK